MAKVKLYYTIRNCGDGSAAVSFHEDQEAAQLACDIEDEEGEPFSENDVNTIELEFDASGKLLNPRQTKAELRRRLAEARGKEEADEGVEEEISATAAEFQQAAQKAPLSIPKSAPATDDPGLSGKVVVFTGTLAGMRRTEAARIAASLGARVSSFVSKNTDFVIAGKDAGSKLQEARTLGVKTITEAEWNKKVADATSARKPAAPRPPV